MKPVFSQEKKILADDVNVLRELRTSTFFRWLQEISIAHTEKLGQGRAKTLDKGALWILARVKICFSRVPVYDEKVCLSTWPSETMHVLFPRNYLLTDEDGQCLARASATWLLMDAKTRTMVFPQNFGVRVKGVTIGGELSPSEGVTQCATDKTVKREVTFRDIDINTHLNSARYLDLLDDVLGAAFLTENKLCELEIDYLGEARLGEIMELKYAVSGGNVYMEGNVGARPCIKLKAKFLKK